MRGPRTRTLCFGPRRGPTPRVRGPLHHDHSWLGREGINPAGAGTTAASRGRPRCPWDQPRGCGDHPAITSYVRVVEGPTPRVRGPPPRWTRGAAGGGTNPAGAGTTAAMDSRRRWRRDQPRGCGDHGGRGGELRRHLGPTPRVRGPRPAPTKGGIMQGTNPAGAGTTAESAGSPPATRDQPRGCGDHVAVATGLAAVMGPTPRVRGPRVEQGLVGGPPRDQPRGCGDHTSA